MKLSMRHIFNLSVVVLAAAYVTIAVGYNRQARLMPLVIGVPVLVLAVWQTVVDFVADRSRQGVRKQNKAAVEKPGAAAGRMQKEPAVYAWVIFLFASLYLIGFVATTFSFTFLSLKARSRFSWKSSIAVSLSCLVFIYFVLIQALHVDLYAGFIPLALRKTFYGY